MLKREEAECQVIELLCDFNKDDLSHAKCRLKYEIDHQERRVGFILGAVSKLGFFPALFSLSSAYSGAFIPPLPFGLDTLIWAAIVGLFLGASYSGVTMIDFRSMIFLIDRALQQGK